MFAFYNKNPHNRHVDDCTIRSISIAEDKTWNQTYRELSDLARSKGLMFNSVEFIEEYLDERYDRSCYTTTSVGEFVDRHPYGVYLITMPGHITVAIDGTIFDSFDCSDRIMWCAWKVED